MAIIGDDYVGLASSGPSKCQLTAMLRPCGTNWHTQHRSSARDIGDGPPVRVPALSLRGASTLRTAQTE